MLAPAQWVLVRSDSTDDNEYRFTEAFTTETSFLRTMVIIRCLYTLQCLSTREDACPQALSCANTLY